MFKHQMREITCCIPQRLLNHWSLCSWGAASALRDTKQCHKYHHPCTTANRTFVLLWQISSLLPFLAGISSHVEAVLLQRTEATAAAAGLSCLPLPASYQTSVQGQSCCGSRYKSETSWKRTVRKRAVPTQVIVHLRCVWDEDFFHLWSPHGNRFQLPGKLDNWEAEDTFKLWWCPVKKQLLNM